jgi:hypothetical protein
MRSAATHKSVASSRCSKTVGPKGYCYWHVERIDHCRPTDKSLVGSEKPELSAIIVEKIPFHSSSRLLLSAGRGQHHRHRRKWNLLSLGSFSHDPNGSLAELFLMTLLHMAQQLLVEPFVCQFSRRISFYCRECEYQVASGTLQHGTSLWECFRFAAHANGADSSHLLPRDPTVKIDRGNRDCQ